jgi:hypothetical protein
MGTVQARELGPKPPRIQWARLAGVRRILEGRTSQQDVIVLKEVRKMYRGLDCQSKFAVRGMSFAIPRSAAVMVTGVTARSQQTCRWCEDMTPLGANGYEGACALSCA